MARPRRTEYSVFDSEYVAQVVRQEWGWKSARCEFWNRGSGDTYRIEQQGRNAYLKIYRRGWRSRAEIEGEVDLLRFLGKRNVRVASPVRNNAGAFVVKIDAAEGRRYAVLFSEARGVEPELNPGNYKAYGRLLAMVHKATDSLPYSIRRPLLDMDHLAREPLERIYPYLVRRPKDLAYLTRISEDLGEAIASLLPVSAPEFGICHGDVTFGNLRCDERGRFTLFDFDCSGYGWRSYDVAVSLWSHGFEFSRSARAARTKKWNAFMEGYHAVRSLSPVELQAVNMFVPLRQIWSMGLHSNLWGGFGRRALHDANFETYLRFIRYWIKAYKLL